MINVFLSGMTFGTLRVHYFLPTGLGLSVTQVYTFMLNHLLSLEKLALAIYNVWWSVRHTNAHLWYYRPTGEADRVIWMPSSSKRFQVTSSYQNLVQHRPKVYWFHLVWFKEAIPKHCFISWLSMFNRLSTRDRHHKITPSIYNVCLFWGFESRNHLFFYCNFSTKIWRTILIKSGNVRHLPCWLGREFYLGVQSMVKKHKAEFNKNLIRTNLIKNFIFNIN